MESGGMVTRNIHEEGFCISDRFRHRIRTPKKRIIGAYSSTSQVLMSGMEPRLRAHNRQIIHRLRDSRDSHFV